MKHRLADVDVVVPVRIDTGDRLENLATVLAYFAECFEGQRVTVLEHAPEARARDCAAKHAAHYHFIETEGCFHKSRVLNLGIALAERPWVLVYDCDVLLAPMAVAQARRLLCEDQADFVYPYNGILLEIARERVLAGSDGVAPVLAGLPERVSDRSCALPAGVEFLHGTAEEPSSGAALLANRRRLILAGGYNENIVSYGCEDTELATRLEKLGTRVQWLEAYSAYHIAHRRGQDSRYNNFHTTNLAEWNKVRGMDRATLEAYVRNGFRELSLDSRATLAVKNTPVEFSMRLSTASTIALDDVAFVLPVPAATATLRAWVERFIERLDSTYDNFELYLAEIGGYGFQASGHRDHVLYRHAPSADEKDWLRSAAEHTSRAILCVCSPFTDVSPDSLIEAIGLVRGSPRSVASLPTQAPEGASARSDKVARLVLGSLPLRGDALVFAREAYLSAAPGGARVEAPPATRASKTSVTPTPGAGSAEPLDLDALRRRLEAAASGRATS